MRRGQSTGRLVAENARAVVDPETVFSLTAIESAVRNKQIQVAVAVHVAGQQAAGGVVKSGRETLQRLLAELPVPLVHQNRIDAGEVRHRGVVPDRDKRHRQAAHNQVLISVAVQVENGNVGGVARLDRHAFHQAVREVPLAVVGENQHGQRVEPQEERYSSHVRRAVAVQVAKLHGSGTHVLLGQALVGFVREVTGAVVDQQRVPEPIFAGTAIGDEEIQVAVQIHVDEFHPGRVKIQVR